MGSYSSPSESSSIRSLTKEDVFSDCLDEGARPVHSKEMAFGNYNIHDFVPLYVRERFRNKIEPILCTMKAVCKADKKTPCYTFTLTWYGTPTHSIYNDVDLVCDDEPADSHAELRQQRSMQNMETSVELGSATSLTNEVNRRCDGPCKKMRSAKELRINGRCDHAICPLCNINAPVIKNVDGSMGCCNPQCFAADLAVLCPDPILRHKYLQMIINNRKLDEITAAAHNLNKDDGKLKRFRRAMEVISSSQGSSESQSSSSKLDLKELINVKVLILEKGPLETICRHHFVNETGSTETLRKALQWIIGDRRDVDKSRVFFNLGNNKNSELREIDMRRLGDKKICNFPLTNGEISFVIDYTNLVRGETNSPYVR
ncbi:unnamed protein product [Thelazia callipaeda]|uniref:SP-RING-type domain-containing protein n=1 Tax=Thelazia callipaeda TaxID=103827 RepID=A0A0N5D1T6_THECL|nr:unnamed protein product [Thelazia callipaeda]